MPSTVLASSFTILLLLGAAAPALAQDGPAPTPTPLKVGISPFPPFVVIGSPATGYSIDVWERVAARLGRPYELVQCKGAAEKLERLKLGQIDVAIGGLTTSAEREGTVDFTHPVYRSGLGIMLPGSGAGPTLVGRLTGALTGSDPTIVIAFFVMVLIAGHLVWFIERGSGGFSNNYVKGIFEGVYWAVVTASTVGYGDKAPVKPAGRILAMLVIVVSLPLFAVFTAELASAFTLQSIEANVRGPEDLKNRIVGVVRGTSSAKFAAERGLEIRQWDNATELYANLRSGQVAAVIYDAPNLKYYAQTEGNGEVHMIRQTFAVRDLALATPQGSPLREEINRALLALDARGDLTDLRVKWFGSSN